MIQALRQATADDDWPAVRRLAHSIKPTVVLLHITGGTVAIETLENQHATTPAIKKAAFTLIRQLQLACEAMRQEQIAS
jgi:hypothetical protein